MKCVWRCEVAPSVVVVVGSACAAPPPARPPRQAVVNVPEAHLRTPSPGERIEAASHVTNAREARASS
jgi:hypothetical protein